MNYMSENNTTPFPRGHNKKNPTKREKSHKQVNHPVTTLKEPKSTMNYINAKRLPIKY